MIFNWKTVEFTGLFRNGAAGSGTADGGPLLVAPDYENHFPPLYRNFRRHCNGTVRLRRTPIT